jgi:hypothetical protein
MTYRKRAYSRLEIGRQRESVDVPWDSMRSVIPVPPCICTAA